jgi:hypothetical protein
MSHNDDDAKMGLDYEEFDMGKIDFTKVEEMRRKEWTELA